MDFLYACCIEPYRLGLVEPRALCSVLFGAAQSRCDLGAVREETDNSAMQMTRIANRESQQLTVARCGAGCP